MSDENNRDLATGQFKSAEPAFGLEGIERDAGYVPYKEETSTEEPVTVEEAAQSLTESRTPESEIRTYSAIDDLPENVTLTIEQAAELKSREDAAKAEAGKDAE